MAHRTLIGGTGYTVTGGTDLIDGTARSRTAGRTLVDGTAYAIGFGGLDVLRIAFLCLFHVRSFL